MPDIAKAGVEAVLGNPVTFRMLSAGLGPSTLVLAFHNVVSESAVPRGDQSLHLPVTTFCRIVDWLAEEFDVVPLDEALDSVGSLASPGGKPRAVITFDDAYVGAISVAIPELWRRRLPATVFAISGADPGRTFWWDALADGFSDGMPDSVRDAALTEARGDEDSVRAWAHKQGLPLSELDGEFVASSWESIRLAAKLPGITIASHTRSHPNLAELGAEEVVRELEDSRRELERQIPESQPWLAYPYGLSSPAVETVAESVGYELAFQVTGGVIRRKDALPSRYALPRLNIPAGLSLRGFRLRAAGLLGR
jgi:peptidoglycan/xylan/chitin deacetylase (PgdA/CDA1 family)